MIEFLREGWLCGALSVPHTHLPHPAHASQDGRLAGELGKDEQGIPLSGVFSVAMSPRAVFSTVRES